MHRSSVNVNITRLIYLLVCQSAGVAIALSTKGTLIEMSLATGLLIGLFIGLVFIGIERLMQGFTLRGFSTATFGLGVGLFCAWLLTRVEISNLLILAFRHQIDKAEYGETMVSSLQLAVDVTLFASFGFLGAMLALRSNRDDFAFIIPYVRFRRDASSGHPIVVDAETIMDGRILGLLSSGFIYGRLIVDILVLEQIQTLANDPAASNLIRQRAQRGLDNIEKIQTSPSIQISMHDARIEGANQDLSSRLIETALFYGAHLLTLDDSLAKVAKLQGVSVLNLNELDLALRPAVTLGERLRVALVRPGKEDHQAVGYLPDGTMIVVNQGAKHIGSMVDVIVVTNLQTAGGTLIFGELHNA